MTDIVSNDGSNDKLDRVIKEVVKQSQLYTNVNKLEEGKDLMTEAVTDIAKIISQIRPDFGEKELIDVTSGIVFSTLALKRKNEKLGSSDSN